MLLHTARNLKAPFCSTLWQEPPLIRRRVVTLSPRNWPQDPRSTSPMPQRSRQHCRTLLRRVLVSIKVRSLIFAILVNHTQPFPELISAVPSSNPSFVARNFTDAEAAYCRSQPSPASSFAARWAGKEAVFKSLGVPSKGASAAMKDIEILPNSEGVPTVTLHGDAKAAAASKGISNIHISLSHSEVRFGLLSLVFTVLIMFNRLSPSPLLKQRLRNSHRTFNRLLQVFVVVAFVFIVCSCHVASLVMFFTHNRFRFFSLSCL